MSTEQHLKIRDPADNSPDREHLQARVPGPLAGVGQFGLGTPPAASPCETLDEFDSGWLDFLCYLGLAGLLALMAGALHWKLH
jgi:hypothetical protein